MKAKKMFFCIIFVGVLNIYFNIASAECAASSIGIVYCSKHPIGGAIANGLGTVECGKGQCRKDRLGFVKCSTVEGGGAAINSIGIVKCFKECETGSSSMCVQGQ